MGSRGAGDGPADRSPGRAGRPGRAASAGREGLPRNSRIRLGSEIRSLLRRGTRHRGSLFELFSAPASGDAARYGTIVPRYGRTAVRRNRLRRRLRELGRRYALPDLRTRGCAADVLVRTRPRAYDASFDELRDELHALMEKLCSSALS